MKISKCQLRQIIKEEYDFLIQESVGPELHRCMDGTMVDPSSQACHDDIVGRIEDAVHHRNSHSCGTENRIYYNGLLKGLRQKRNRLAKSLAFSQEAE